MTATDLSNFLHLGEPPALKLCLPRFAGAATAGQGMSYPGFVHADRDVRSAQEVERLACSTGAAIELISPDDAIAALTQHDRTQTLVIFGSRSNDALPKVISESRLSELVTFSFSDEWTIRTRDGATYSLSDPSKLDRESYSAATDYGVIAGLIDEGQTPLFIVAGLGGRATEGCGQFLRHNGQIWPHVAEGAPLLLCFGFPHRSDRNIQSWLSSSSSAIRPTGLHRFLLL